MDTITAPSPHPSQPAPKPPLFANLEEFRRFCDALCRYIAATVADDVPVTVGFKETCPQFASVPDGLIMEAIGRLVKAGVLYLEPAPPTPAGMERYSIRVR